MNILTIEQVAEAIYVDDDFSKKTLQIYADSASSYIKEKTGYDFSQDTEIHPLATQCALLYVKNLHFGSRGYNEKHDYSLGINSLLVDLQVIARERLSV